MFLLLKACLGISIQAHQPQITVAQNFLPLSLKEVTIKNLQIADATLSLSIRRSPEGAEVIVSPQHGEIKVASAEGVEVVTSHSR